MKRTAKRLLTIVFSIMIVMMYMMPGSVFADGTGGTAAVYQLVDSLEDGGEYIISNGNDSGSFSALKNPGGTSGGASMGNTAITIEDSDGVLFVREPADDIIWKATAKESGFMLTNGTDYLEGKGGKIKIFDSCQYADRYWQYSGNQLKHTGGQNTYTLYYDNGFTSTYNETDEKVYFFEKHTENQNTDPVPVESITLDKEEITVEEGRTATLKATVLPENADDRTVAWTSADTSVATVNASGVVTGVSAGTTRIEAVAGEFTASCTVTVREKSSADETTNIGVTSDVHGNITDLTSWLETVQADYEPDLDSMIYCGDYSYKMNDLEAFVGEFQQIVDVTNTLVGEGKGIYTSGNHEYYINNHEIPLDERFLNTPGFVRLGEALVRDNYIVYCMGAASWGNNAVGEYPQEDIDALEAYLDSAPEDIPILIPAHFPLHFISGRTVANADKVIDVLNDHPNAIFLWGHNHSQNDSHYGNIVESGGSIEYASGKSKEINFTYACAGGMYQDSQTNYSGVVLSVNPDGKEVVFQYYRARAQIPIGEPKTIHIGGTQVVRHTITASAGNNGSITPSGEITVKEGTDKTFEFTADAGYEIDKVTVDGEEVNVEDGNYSFTDIDADHTIHVTFKEAEVTEYVLTDSVKSGDSYVLVSNGYALLNDEGVINKVPVQTSEDGKSVYINKNDCGDSISWTLHDSATGETSGDFTIENNGYKLSRIGDGSNNPSEITTEEKTSETSGLPYYQWSYDAENTLLTNTGGQDGDTAFYFFYDTTEKGFYTSTTEEKTGLYVPAKSDIVWEEPTYTWSGDNKECTAKRISSDGTVEEKETVTADIETEAATCLEEGKKTYTAVFENDAFEKQIKEETIPALGHRYRFTGFEWAEDYCTANAVFTCEHDASHVYRINVFVNKYVCAPTCETPGYMTCTASVLDFNDGSNHVDTKSVELPATGHCYTNSRWSWSNDNKQAELSLTCANCGRCERIEAEVETESTEPTCTESGKHIYTAEAECNNRYYESTKEVTEPATGHSWEQVTEPATFDADGCIYQICSVCGEREDVEQIPKAGRISISNTTYTYTGKKIKPEITILDSEGKSIENTNYDVSYASGCTNVGKCNVSVKMKGKYSGSGTVNFTIKPRKAVIDSVKTDTGQVKVTMSKKISETGGKYYQINYRIKGNSSWKTLKTTAKTLTIKNLKKGRIYQIKVRAYKAVSGNTYYGEWSKIKTTKKVK